MFWNVFDNRERRNVVLLCIGILFSGVFQTVGISAIMPFVSAIANPSRATHSHIYHAIAQTIQNTRPQAVLLFYGVAVLMLLVGGNVLIGVTQYSIIRFSTMRQYHFSVQLFETYLQRPYAFFVSTNSAELSRNILSEVTRVVNQVLMPLLNATANGVVAVSIVAFLVAVNPMVALLTGGVMGGGYGLVYLLIRSRMTRLGRDRLAANRELYKSSAEAFGAIKEIKMLNAEKVIAQPFVQSALRFAKRDATNTMANQLPRYAIESIAFGGVVALLLFLARGANAFSTGMPLVTMYVFAGYKLMPALQNLFRGLGQARYGISTIETLFGDLANQESTNSHEISTSNESPSQPRPPSIELLEVDLSFPNRASPALDNVTLKIEPYSSTGIVGQTGSGKSTLIDVICGLLIPDGGMVVAGGRPLNAKNLKEWQRRIGYVPQSIALLDMSVAANIALGVPETEIDYARVQWAAERALLHDFVVTELPNKYLTHIGQNGIQISGGQRQRIGIARALYRNVDVLVLDEATSALDTITEDSVMKSISQTEKPMTVISVAHRISTIRRCSCIYLLDGGRIMDKGSYFDLVNRNPAFAAMAR